MGCPAPLCPARPMSLGAAHPTAPRHDGGVLFVLVQTDKVPAISTRAKPEPGGAMGASWNLPPAPARGQDTDGETAPCGAGSRAIGSWCSHPRPRAEGWQWGRAGGPELLRHDSPAVRTAGVVSPAALPRCLAISKAASAGSQAAVTSLCQTLLRGTAAEEPLSSPTPAATLQGHRAERGPEDTAPAEEQLHNHRRLLPRGSGSERG